MKKRFQIYIAVFFVVSIFCQVASATDINVCFEWPYDYDDMDKDEDYLLPDSSGIGTAIVGKMQYILKLGNDEVERGRLDSNGCVEFKDFEPSKVFKILVLADVKGEDGRGFSIISSKSDHWENGAKVFGVSRYFGLFDETEDGRTYTFTGTQRPETRALVGANHVMSRYVEVNWREDRRMHIAVENSTLCEKNANYWQSTTDHDAEIDAKVKHICMRSGRPNQRVTEKTQLAHEMGHAIASMWGGPIIGAYNGDHSSGARYRVNGSPCRRDPNKDSKKSHAFNTREWVGSAAKEGFAHFIAAASLNSRTPLNGAFAYYKGKDGERRDAITLDPIAEHAPMPLNPPPGEETWQQFTEKNCRPPSKFPHLGSEGDWLFFFWGLWTGGQTVRFDVSEINNIWNQTRTELNSDNSHYSAIDVHCVPRTTRIDYIIHNDPAPGYEKRWTCWGSPRLFVSWELLTFTNSDSGSESTVVIPHEARLTTRSIRGRKFGEVEATMRQMNPGNSGKIIYFNNTASNAKVVY